MKIPKDIQTFLLSLSGWQHTYCTHIITSILAASPYIQSSIKWNNPYFDLHGSFIKLFVAKDWINIYFYKGHLLNSNLFEKTDNNYMRTIKIYKDSKLDNTKFITLLDEAIKLNTKNLQHKLFTLDKYYKLYYT